MFLYKPSFIPMTFAIVGVGGTGGRLVPLLSQFLKTVSWIQNPKIFLIDHDMVEEKNLLRQNFIRPDVGKPKALVLAQRYGKAFDINIIPVVKEIKDPSLSSSNNDVVLDESDSPDLGIVKQFFSRLHNAIVILCVDSASSRRAILNNLFYNQYTRNLLIIDAGNENDFGQVMVYNDSIYVPSTQWTKELIKGLEVPGLGYPVDINIPTIPFPADFYRGLKDNSSVSCADLDQTLAINATMATSIFGIIQNFLYNKFISFHRMNISLTSGAIPEQITLNYLWRLQEDVGAMQKKPYLSYPKGATPDTFLQNLYNSMESFKNEQIKKSSKQKSSKEDVEKVVKKEVLV